MKNIKETCLFFGVSSRKMSFKHPYLTKMFINERTLKLNFMNATNHLVYKHLA